MTARAAKHKNAIKWLVAAVMLLNLGYFAIELYIGNSIGSVSLTADSIDFLGDAAINTLILVGLFTGTHLHPGLRHVMAALMLLPILATILLAWQKFDALEVPTLFPFMITGAGALLVNLICAFLLVIYSRLAEDVRAASYYYERNDAIANIAVICTGIFTAVFWTSAWPDLVVGVILGLINMKSAYTVWVTGRGLDQAVN